MHNLFYFKADLLAKVGVGINSVNVDSKYNVNILYEEEHEFYKNFYKSVFKGPIVLEMVYLNSNLNDLSVQELLFNAKIKNYNLKEFLEKKYSSHGIYGP